MGPSKPMHRAIPRPPPKRLPAEIKQDAEETPQQDQGHIRHDRRHKARLNHPRSNELRESVPPHVLVDGDGDHQGAGDGLVGVDGVGGRHGGERGDLDAGGGVADDDDGFPGPSFFGVSAVFSLMSVFGNLLLLVTEGSDEVAEKHEADVGNCGPY